MSGKLILNSMAKTPPDLGAGTGWCITSVEQEPGVMSDQRSPLGKYPG
jgi:hypothetical protein